MAAGELGVWVTIGLAVVAGIGGYGRLQARVENHAEELKTKVDKDVLQQIDGRLARIESAVLKLSNSR